MIHEKIFPNILAAQIIPSVSTELMQALSLKPEQKCIGIITADIDDATYVGLDHATKDAMAEVVYARSFYAGSANASTALAGEVIGILAGANPADVKSAVQSCISYMKNEAYFVSANEDGSICYFAHTVSRTGSYLSKLAGIGQGEALAYLIAPPIEAVCGLDAALKASDVRMCEFFAPPSETNFAGGLLTGTRSACEAACDAFAQKVEQIARDPLSIDRY